MTQLDAIVSERLLVRGYQPGDYESYRRLCAESDVDRFMHWPPPPDGPDELVARSHGRSLLDGQGWLNLAVECRQTGAYVGDHALDIAGSRARLGLALVAAQRGRGLAQELIVASTGFLSGKGVERFVAEIDVGNDRSRRLFERLDFHLVAEECDEMGAYWVMERAGRPGWKTR